MIIGDVLRLQKFQMAAKASKPAPRKPRADARRNRQRILELAKKAFTRSGANISLDEVAKQAGVGAGTLYRHFPTREALLEAVYRTEVEKLAAAERKLSEPCLPVEALRAWMLLLSTTSPRSRSSRLCPQHKRTACEWRQPYGRRHRTARVW